ncbi:hypothetical protein UKS_13690 [Streptococcus sp. 116-D4]|nr:hypothetical protein UKS_13690 [Streptococcus sp. 116-D4]
MKKFTRAHFKPDSDHVKDFDEKLVFLAVTEFSLFTPSIETSKLRRSSGGFYPELRNSKAK